MFAPPPNIFMGGGDCSPAPPGSTPLGASDLDEQGGMCTVADPGFAKKGWARAPHTGGVQGPAVGPLPGAQGAVPPEALEFSANKGLQDGRQE